MDCNERVTRESYMKIDCEERESSDSADYRLKRDVPHISLHSSLPQTELESRKTDRATLQVHYVEVRLQQPSELQRP